MTHPSPAMAEAAEGARQRPHEGDAAPSAAAAVEPQYKYLRIADALKAKRNPVSLFAVVAEIRLAVKSGGPDFTRTLRIVDESPPAGISATFFAKNAAQLPCVKSSGDVISLHEVKIKMHEGHHVVAFDKKSSSFALFEGKVFGECSPYQISTKYQGSEHDEEILRQTRTWVPDNHIDVWMRRQLNHFLYILKYHLFPGRFYAQCHVFCNMTCKQEFGIWKGILLESSTVRLLSHEDGSVIDRLKMYDSRNANQVHRQPMTSFPEASNVTVLSDVKYKRAPYTTLMQSLTHNEVTHKFKTLVRVVVACPCPTSELRLLSMSNFCVRLTLEDPTARIHAYVHKNYAVKFFGGSLTVENLIKKMNKLLGVPEHIKEGAPLTRNPPWIWCCLKSYYLDQNDPWDSRRYQIFSTEMRG